jgi:succinate dehydrogenase / fumarate reductase cytochrome b subunit
VRPPLQGTKIGTQSIPPAASKTRPEFRNIHVSQILKYKLPPPGMVSIMHRISGAALFLTLPFLLWLFDLSLTSELSYTRLADFATHWLVKLIVLGLAWASCHLVAGVRYRCRPGCRGRQAWRAAARLLCTLLPLTLLAAVSECSVVSNTPPIPRHRFQAVVVARTTGSAISAAAPDGRR